MSQLTHVLNLVLAREFYRSNATFFLVVIGLACGFMSSVEHIALANFFMATPLLAAIPVGLWTGYSLKVCAFNREALQRQENQFVHNLVILPAREQWIVACPAVLIQMIPMILYGAFLMIIGWKNAAYATFILIGCCIVILLFLVVLILMISLNGSPEQEVWSITRHINNIFRRPFPLFFPEWIARREPGLLVGTKLAGCLILMAVERLYRAETYDLRLIAMGIVVVFAGHCGLIWQIHRFNNHHFSLLRNLPRLFGRHVTDFIITVMILVMPEVGITISNYHILPDWISLASVILFSLSIPVLIYGFLYVKDRSQEQLTGITFYCSMAMIVLILFKVPLLLLAAVNFTVGLTLLKRFYYSFEYISIEQS